MTLNDIAEHAVEVTRAFNPSLKPFAERTEIERDRLAQRVRTFLTTIPRKPSGNGIDNEVEDAIFDAVCERLGKYL